MDIKDLKELMQPTQLWDLNIKEVTGHSLEASTRDEVNKMLQEEWILLHIYTLKYHDETDGDGTWRERPMAILGKPTKQRKLA